MRSRNLAVFSIVFLLSTPIFVSAATECTDRNVFGAKIDGRCVYFSKGDGPNICTADKPGGYGVSTFSCPEEFLRKYEEKVAAEQEKIDAEQKEKEQQEEEELNEKIREAVEEQLKEQEKVRNDEVVSTQIPAVVIPVIAPKPISPQVPVEIINKTTPTPNSDIPAENLENNAIAEFVATEAVQNNEIKTSLWTHITGFLSRLNPFGWFK